MPININQVDMQGLSQLAGNRLGPLNLPIHSVDMGFEGAKAKAQLDEQYAAQANQLKNTGLIVKGEQERQLLQNKGALDLGQQQNLFAGTQNDLNRAIQQQLADQQGQYQQEQIGLGQGQLKLGYSQLAQKNNIDLGQLDINRGQLGVNQQQVAQQGKLIDSEVIANTYKAAIDLRQDQRNQIGALAGATKLAILYAKTPEEQQQAMQNSIDIGIQSGIFKDKQEALQHIDPTNPTKTIQMLDMAMNLMGGADHAVKQGASIGQGGGVIFSQGTNGVLQANMPLSADSLKKAQDDLGKIQELQQSVSSLMPGQPGGYKPEWDQGFGGNVGIPVLGHLESAFDINAGKDTYAEQRAEKQAWDTKATGLNVDFADLKGVKLSTRNEKILGNLLITKHDDEGTKPAKLAAIAQLLEVEKQMLKQQITQGTPITPEQNKMINDKISELDPSKEKTYTDKFGKTYTHQQVVNTAKANKTTEEDILKQMGAK